MDYRLGLAEGCWLVLRRIRLLSCRWRWRSSWIKLEVGRSLLMHGGRWTLANLCDGRCKCHLWRWCFEIGKMHRQLF